jgi:tetratricopeptide (TPR) repeat protein
MRDWFRCREWTQQNEAEFFRRLKRARHHRPQYLTIQALTLVDSGSPELAAIALNLVELFLQEYNRHLFTSQAFHIRARALLLLERGADAFQAFEDALAARRLMPNVIDDAWLDYPLAIARRRIRERYPRALDVLNEFLSPHALMLPVQQFRYFATLALISADEGDRDGALRWARNALEACSRNAPFSRHPDLGLVGMSDADLQIQLEEMVGD